MHEFLGLGQVGAGFQLLLDEILDRFDVVVGGALDVLDACRLLRRKAAGDAAQELRLLSVEGRQFSDVGFIGQCDQPFHLNMHTRFDQPEFRENRPQGVDFGGVTAIDGRQGKQGVVGHKGELSDRKEAMPDKPLLERMDANCTAKRRYHRESDRSGAGP